MLPLFSNLIRPLGALVSSSNSALSTCALYCLLTWRQHSPCFVLGCPLGAGKKSHITVGPFVVPMETLKSFVSSQSAWKTSLNVLLWFSYSFLQPAYSHLPHACWVSYLCFFFFLLSHLKFLLTTS